MYLESHIYARINMYSFFFNVSVKEIQKSKKVKNVLNNNKKESPRSKVVESGLGVGCFFLDSGTH